MSVPIRNILVPSDFSPQAGHALLYAASVAERYGATIHVLHVVTLHDTHKDDEDTDFPDVMPFVERADAAARAKLDAGALDEGEAEVEVTTAVRRSVNAHEAVLEYAGEQSIDLIVIATRGRSALSYLMLGSVTERVIRYAPCPVLVVEQGDRDFVDPDSGAVSLKRVVIAHDLSDNAQRMLAYAVDKLAPYQPELRVVHVVENEMPAAYTEMGLQPAYDLSSEFVARVRSGLAERAAEIVPAGWTVEIDVLAGKVHRELTGYAEEHEADLLVVGSETNRTLKERLVGGTSEQIVRYAPCPTLIC